MISRKGEARLEELREDILKFARYVQTLYGKTKMAFLERNDHHARDVIYSSTILDSFQVNIERKIVTLTGTLILRGKNLRFLTTGMKLVTKLRRIGRHCISISQSSMELSKYSPIGFYNSMSKMVNIVDEMLNGSVKNISSPSLGLSAQICTRDNAVDTLLAGIEKEITETLIQNPQITPQGVKLINILKEFEEIADLSTTLVECSVFIETGKYYKCVGDDFFEFENLKD
ncbi:phosphate signaling complex PhoU family protein [Kosmotoga pacifica]|uniref:PhoU domain-containing protein n=1 Tax=Kosmotoga pacifica TaxID=1330330 RepID=A0A0G2Z576_9BACT|nr:phosphate uptake regulator PhoU [Kosmotoga pacifica]AKI96770.1 hypothetical protein IX53_01860 [Kosmotoga pacifica]